MNRVKIEGAIKKHKVLMYTLSTCPWCKLAKKYMKDHNVEHEYIDVDLCNEKDYEEIRQDILRRGGTLLFPTIIIDNKILITNFQKDKIDEALEI